MSFAKVRSAQTSFLKAHIVDVEVDLSKGLHSFSIVGLPDKAVEEAKDRISAAIKNSGFKSPKQYNQKIVIALAPAEIKKEGSNFDLAMALGYLLANGDIRFDPLNKIFFGELSLDGLIRPMHGVLPLVKKAKEEGIEEIFVAKENANEAALIDGISIFPAETLGELIAHLEKRKNEKGEILSLTKQPATEINFEQNENELDFADIRGQESAKRALTIAAAGGHNIALWGPPGTGKSMLAKAFAGILPPLTFENILEVTSIHSIAGALNDLQIHPPFRSPHHTSSHVAIVGGGASVRPGEITLAHRGVLFLDEFPEFDRRVIESLREPLEERVISISRAKGSARFPAHFILIAAMNPCPCGYYGLKGKNCTCAASAIERYRRKMSGPIVDRIDLWVEVSSIPHEELSRKRDGSSESVKVREQIIRARDIQKKRFNKHPKKIETNSEMSVRDLVNNVTLDEDVKNILNQSARNLDLSPRSYHRVIKIARTIADLAGSEKVVEDNILEALQYRPKKNGL